MLNEIPVPFPTLNIN